jgi:hypothetical protein
VSASEGAKSFRISSAAIMPELLVRAAPALDATAFLEANFKHGDDARCCPGGSRSIATASTWAAARWR